MEAMIAARVLHVLGVVLWIGGVAFVTAVLLPAATRMRSPQERIAFFESVERRFASHARITTLVTGATGLYLVHALDAWRRFERVEYWWMHAMVAIWALFTLLLFVIEPLAHRRSSTRSTDAAVSAAYAEQPRHASDRAFTRVVRMHWILLGASLLTIAGAVAGSHGYLLFAR